ncbi:MAG: hypothetical protein M1813_004036 [Trichoglossum hirsutum]|nr:MAG: hypothetical protein M1813_004036 [Trichoglossum hirsutum]
MLAFKVNCPSPPSHANFVSSPNIRGTLDILWSSLATLFLCTWAVQSLNVPPQVRSRTSTQKQLRNLKLVWRKAVWMLVTVLAPEYLVAKALAERLSASWSCEKLRRWAEEDEVEWTITHSYFSDMGGFVIRFTDETPDTEIVTGTDPSPGDDCDASSAIAEAPSSPESPERPALAEHEEPEASQDETLSAHEVKMPPASPGGGAPDVVVVDTNQQGDQPPPPQVVRDAESGITSKSRKNSILVKKAVLQVKHDTLAENIFCLRGNVWNVDAAQLLLTRQLGIISALPSVSEEELEDQSKADAAVKTLAVIQVTWMIVQQLMRCVNHLPSSQLEIVVLALAACAGVVYALRWNKPKDVQTPRYIAASRYPRDAGELEQIGTVGPAQTWTFWDHGVSAISNLAVHRYKEEVYPHPMARVAAGGLVASTVFGLLHCIAWNFDFPTPTEKLLWRMASVATAALPCVTCVAALMYVGLIFLYATARKRPLPTAGQPGASTTAFRVGALLLIAVYVVARLYITVEVFRALWYLPPAAFSTTPWILSLPRIT